MLGICNGPAAAEDSSAAESTDRLVADSAVVPGAGGRTPVSRMATSAATASAPAPAPITDVTGTARRPTLCLPTSEPPSLGSAPAASLAARLPTVHGSGDATMTGRRRVAVRIVPERAVVTPGDRRI